MEKAPEDVMREVVGDDLPKGMERRLVHRLLAYWRGLQIDDEFPSFAAIDPGEIPDIWSNTFVLEVVGNESDPVFRAFGDDIAAHYETSLIDRHVSEVPDNSLVSVSVGYLDEVLKKGVPISRGGDFQKDDGTEVLYRSILLPMSDDGETISGILGAANCREVEPE
tara:strand:- start:3943 stop:4440 length:498 start_codon:yes stop_codon:yes gene_type:complete